MRRLLGVGAVVVTGGMLLLLIPFMWVASEEPAHGLPVLISLEGIDLGVENDHISGRKLDREQAANAYYIVATAVWLTGSRRAAVIAVATALQESSLRNLTHGDRPIGSGELGETSRGLFQQMGDIYGYDVAMNPLLATEAFLDRLEAVPGWEAMPLTQAAQAVQRSAHPDGYADEEAAAQVIVDLLWDPIHEAGPGVMRVALVGNYALPISSEWFRAHPDWLSQPHHDYPASDLPVPEGTPVYAVAGGLVVASPVGGACGQGVIIQGDDGVIYTYCHGTSPLVPRGVRVPTGQAIMISGYSGHVIPPGPAGAHLHLQMKLGADGPLVCPQAALQAWSQGITTDVRLLPRDGCIS